MSFEKELEKSPEDLKEEFWKGLKKFKEKLEELKCRCQYDQEKHRLILGVDCGAHKTRIRLAILEDEKVVGYSDDDREIPTKDSPTKSKEDFLSYIGEVAKVAEESFSSKISQACIGFAGPNERREKVTITNWPGRPEITLKELADKLQLAKHNIIILNDLEAAAYGIIALEESSCLEQNQIPIRDKQEPPIHDANKIVIAPGMGLGEGGIVTLQLCKDKRWTDPIATEGGHILFAPRNQFEMKLSEWLQLNRTDGKPPGWERVVSGEGMENIYTFLWEEAKKQNTEGRLDNLTLESWALGRDRVLSAKDKAECIVQLGIKNKDQLCRQALELFYAFCGRAAQSLALAYLPYGGVYLTGATTNANKDFIPDSPFAANFENNDKQANLLRQLPLFMLIKDDLNLDGAVYAAIHRLYLAPSD